MATDTPHPTASSWFASEGSRPSQAQLPVVLYHATYRPYLASIFETGLGGAAQAVPANYEDSEPGVVYLALDADVARSYAETAERVPEDWLDDIVVLAVDRSALRPVLLGPDPNVRPDVDATRAASPSTLAYRGVVPPAALSVLGEAPRSCVPDSRLSPR